jgi:hypothetical protein
LARCAGSPGDVSGGTVLPVRPDDTVPPGAHAVAATLSDLRDRCP